jgi:hypothetical protein
MEAGHVARHRPVRPAGTADLSAAVARCRARSRGQQSTPLHADPRRDDRVRRSAADQPRRPRSGRWHHNGSIATEPAPRPNLRPDLFRVLGLTCLDLRSGRVGPASAAALARLGRPRGGPDRAHQRDYARTRGCLGIPGRHHLGIQRRHCSRPARHQHRGGAPSWPPPPADATPAAATQLLDRLTALDQIRVPAGPVPRRSAGSKSAGSQPADKNNSAAVQATR